MALPERIVEEEKLMSPEEVAGKLRVTAAAVRQWVRTGKLEAFRAGKLIRITPGQLDEFLATSRQKAMEGELSGKPREYTLEEIEQFVADDKLDPELAKRIDSLIEHLR